MNFEHLYKTILLNQNKLKNKKATKRFLTYHYELLNIKKNKLKLGAVTFDLIQTMFEGFLLKQTVEMRYTRQDTSAADVDEDEDKQLVDKQIVFYQKLKKYLIKKR